MRDYQRKRGNPYILPRNLYRQVIYQIKDYDRLCLEYEEIIEASRVLPDGQPKGNLTGDPTFAVAVKLAGISVRIEAIEKAMNEIPAEYRKGVWNNIIKEKSFPLDADRATYYRQKGKFVWNVAKKLNLI